MNHGINLPLQHFQNQVSPRVSNLVSTKGGWQLKSGLLLDLYFRNLGEGGERQGLFSELGMVLFSTFICMALFMLRTFCCFWYT